MATIETAEGRTLIVENDSSSERLWVTARMGPEGGATSEHELRMFDLYKRNALEIGERPRSRSDLTAARIEQIADLLVGYEVARGRAGRRSEVRVESISFEMREDVKDARPPFIPDWEDDWPEDGSASDKVRYLLENQPTFTDAEMAAAAGCSRSLVSDVKASETDE